MTDAKRIFVIATDGSASAAAAARYGASLAGRMGCDVLLVHVVEWSDYSFINALEIEERHRMRQAEQAAAQDRILEPLAKALEKGGAQVQTRVEFGHPAQAVAEIADQRQAEMIVAGTRGRSDVASILLGSFSHNLMHLTTRPVLLVPAEQEKR